MGPLDRKALGQPARPVAAQSALGFRDDPAHHSGMMAPGQPFLGLSAFHGRHVDQAAATLFKELGEVGARDPSLPI
jgi:hypothetical protein